MVLRQCVLFLLTTFCCRGVELSLDDCRTLATRVYSKLVLVVNGTGNPPRMRIQSAKEFQELPGYTQETNRVAFLEIVNGPPIRREIVIDEKTVRVCARLDSKAEACVAFFLGHELAHWASAHDWKGHFARKMGVALQVTSDAESKDRESQADDLGMLYAALAGYDALSVAPQALGEIYKEYSIPSKLPGYLRLTDRQAISLKSSVYLSKMLPLFDAATLLLATERYREAALCYDAILEIFPSREIFNNAAVARAFAAIAAGGRREEFQLAWVLDTETRLPAPPAVRGEADPELRRTLLAEAQHALEAALRRDPEYKPAHANLGLVLKLQGGDSTEIAMHLQKAGQRPATTVERVAVSERHASTVARTELFPQGKRPRDASPSSRPAEMLLADRRKLSHASSDGYRWFRFSTPDNRSVAAVTVHGAEEGFLRSLGTPDRELLAMPGRMLVYERLGAVVIADGENQVRRYTIYEEF